MTENIPAKIEALLFYTNDAMTISDIADACEIDTETTKQAITDLRKRLADRGVTLIEADNTFRIATDSRFNDLIEKHRKESIDTNLTSAQSEALSVVAYMSPVAKPTIDFIRGVNSRTVLRNLSTRGLVKKDESGSEVTYFLTTEALAHLGISQPKDLPEYEATQEKLQEFLATQQEPTNQSAA